MILGGIRVGGRESWNGVCREIAATEHKSVSVMCEVETVLVILQLVILAIKKT